MEKLDSDLIRHGISFPDFEENKTSATSIELTPFFNMKKVNTVTSGGVCANGFYGANVGAFAQTKMIDLMMKYTSSPYNLKFRCNDASSPWGGPYNYGGSWKHSGHQKGLTVDIRYFNTSIRGPACDNDAPQDCYDTGDAKMRRDDVELYLKFSSWAKGIAEKTENLPHKEDMFAICANVLNPLEPCSIISHISDFTHEKIIQFCKWNYKETSILNMCSVMYETSGWEKAVVRYANWADINYTQVRTLTKDFVGIISDGHKDFPVNIPVNLNASEEMKRWQNIALNQGIWPDGLYIYKADSNDNILQSTVYLNTAVPETLNKHFTRGEPNKAVHFHHIDLQYPKQ